MFTSEYLNAIRFIDSCAKENKVYHFNGGQAYIRLQDNWLMVIDTIIKDKAIISIHDGTAYFAEYEGIQYEQSQRICENPLVDYFMKVGA